MPYYKETFVNRTQPVTQTQVFNDGRAPVIRNSTVVMDSVDMTSFRSRPHKRAVGRSKIVEDIIADPYAGFLRRTSERQYREALAARGLTSSGEPDRGHAFSMTRHTIMSHLKSPFQQSSTSRTSANGVVPIFSLSSTSPAGKAVFNGGVNGNVIPYQESASPLASFAQMAYARSAPTPEVFNAATFLGELREGLPTLVPDVLKAYIKDARRKVPSRHGGNNMVRASGGDYLNFQFGWLPLVQDVKNAATALANATAQLAQEGERVQRSYSLPPSVSSELIQIGKTTLQTIGSHPGLVTDPEVLAELGVGGTSAGFAPPPGEGSVHKMRRNKRWFTGEFSSFYRLGFDPSSYIDRARELVNLDITPEVLWELSPWSWLVDWNLRLGDSLRANMLAHDDTLVMHYGYAMEETTYRSLHSISHPDGSTSSSNRSWGNGTSSDTSITTTYKRRIRANPYGFRVNTPAAFTGGQLAILGALGLTKF